MKIYKDKLIHQTSIKIIKIEQFNERPIAGVEGLMVLLDLLIIR